MLKVVVLHGSNAVATLKLGHLTTESVQKGGFSTAQMPWPH